MARTKQPRLNNIKDDLTLDALCRLLEEGIHIQDACNVAEITYNTLVTWCAEDPTVLGRIQKAESTMAVTAGKTIHGVIKGSVADMGGNKVNTAKWWLSKRRRQHGYGDVQTIANESAQLAAIAPTSEETAAIERKARLAVLMGMGEPTQDNTEEVVDATDAVIVVPIPSLPEKRIVKPGGRRATRIIHAVSAPVPARTMADLLPFGVDKPLKMESI